MLKADIADFYSALLKGRQGGWLSPNDCRSETGFAAVAGGDDIAPPVAGMPAGGADDGPASPSPAPSSDEEGGEKVAHIGHQRHKVYRHASD